MSECLFLALVFFSSSVFFSLPIKAWVTFGDVTRRTEKKVEEKTKEKIGKSEGSVTQHACVLACASRSVHARSVSSNACECVWAASLRSRDAPTADFAHVDVVVISKRADRHWRQKHAVFFSAGESAGGGGAAMHYAAKCCKVSARPRIDLIFFKKKNQTREMKKISLKNFIE